MVRALRQQLSDTARQTLAFTEAVSDLKGSQSTVKGGASDMNPPERIVSPEEQPEQRPGSSYPERKVSFQNSQEQPQGDSPMQKSASFQNPEGQAQGRVPIQRKVSFQEPEVTLVISHPLEKKVSFKEPESKQISSSPPETNLSSVEPTRTPKRGSSLERKISFEAPSRKPQRSPSAKSAALEEPKGNTTPQRSRSLERKASLQEPKAPPQRSRSMEKRVSLKEQRRGLPEKRVSFAKPRLNKGKQGAPGPVDGGGDAPQIDAIPAIWALQPSSLNPLRDPAGGNENQGDPEDSHAAEDKASPGSSREPVHDSATLASQASISSLKTETGAQDDKQVRAAARQSKEEGLAVQERSEDRKFSAMPTASQARTDDSRRAIEENMSAEEDMADDAESAEEDMADVAESAKKFKSTWAKGLLGPGAEEEDPAEETDPSASEEGSWKDGGGDDELADLLAVAQPISSEGPTAEGGSSHAPGQGLYSIESEGGEAELAESELAGAFSADLEATTLLVGPLQELRASLEAAERDLEAAEKENTQLRTALRVSDQQRQGDPVIITLQMIGSGYACCQVHACCEILYNERPCSATLSKPDKSSFWHSTPISYTLLTTM